MKNKPKNVRTVPLETEQAIAYTIVHQVVSSAHYASHKQVKAVLKDTMVEFKKYKQNKK